MERVAQDVFERQIKIEVDAVGKVDKVALQDPARRCVGELQLEPLVGIEKLAVVAVIGQLVLDDVPFFENAVADNAAALQVGDRDMHREFQPVVFHGEIERHLAVIHKITVVFAVPVFME